MRLNGGGPMTIWDELKLVHLASQSSFSRGLDYYKNKAVVNSERVAEGVFEGKVRGSNQNFYDVTININHPRQSSCMCPFAKGRSVICKHMVALYFTYFPDQAKSIFDEWEAEELEKEKRYLEIEAAYNKSRQEKFEEVSLYVNNLDEEQVRAALISALMEKFDRDYEDENEYFDDDEDYYDFYY